MRPFPPCGGRTGWGVAPCQGDWRLLAWAGAAFIYLGALLEGWWVVYAGPILICFAALSSTAPMLLQWATRVLAIAIKIAVLLFVLAVGMGLAIFFPGQLQRQVRMALEFFVEPR